MKEFDKSAVLDFTAKYTQFVRKAIRTFPFCSLVIDSFNVPPAQKKRERLMGLWESKAWDLAELGLTCHDVDEPDEDVEEGETSDHQGRQLSDPPRPSRRKAKKRTNPTQDQAQKKAQPSPPIPSTRVDPPDLHASNNSIGRPSIQAYLDPALMAPSLTGINASSSRSGPSSPSQSEFDEPPFVHELPTPSLSRPAYLHSPPPINHALPSPSLSGPAHPRSPPPADNEPSPSLSAPHYPCSTPPDDDDPPSPSLSATHHPRSPPPADDGPPSPSLSDDFASPFLTHTGDITHPPGTVPQNHSGTSCFDSYRLPVIILTSLISRFRVVQSAAPYALGRTIRADAHDARDGIDRYRCCARWSEV